MTVENSVGGVSEKFHSGGGSSNYYRVTVSRPLDGREPYEAQCLDIIMALEMDFAEGEAFKAIWRKASSRQGNGKEGNSGLYNADKVAFFGNVMVMHEKEKAP